MNPHALVQWSALISSFILGVAMVLCTVRLFLGPTAQDRVLALDTMYYLAMLLVLVFGIYAGTVLYFEVALLIALVGFVSTMALAKFLLRGEVIE